MKTILIPTDFSKNSILLLKSAVLHYSEEKIKIVLVAGYKMSLNNYSAISYSKPKLIRTLATKEFDKNLTNLLEEFKGQITNCKIELYTGTTSLVFKDFLKSQDITCALTPSVCLNQFNNKRCYDMSKLIKKHVTDSVDVSYTNDVLGTEKSNKLSLSNLIQQFSLK